MFFSWLKKDNSEMPRTKAERKIISFSRLQEAFAVERERDLEKTCPKNICGF